MAIMGTSLAVAAIFGQGTPEQIGEWIPQCFGTRRRAEGRRLLRLRARRRLRRLGDPHHAPSTTRRPDEWVLNGQKAWATNGGIADVHVVIASVDRELGSRGHAAFVDPARHARACEQGAKVKKHGLRASHTADVHLDDCRVPGACLLGGKEKLDERLARVREGKQGQVAGGDGRPSRPAGRRSARRRSASPAPPTSTRSSTPRSASSSAARSSRTRRSRSRSPT